jgi:hypothetical protein
MDKIFVENGAQKEETLDAATASPVIEAITYYDGCIVLTGNNRCVKCGAREDTAAEAGDYGQSVCYDVIISPNNIVWLQEEFDDKSSCTWCKGKLYASTRQDLRARFDYANQSAEDQIERYSDRVDADELLWMEEVEEDEQEGEEE